MTARRMRMYGRGGDPRGDDPDLEDLFVNGFRL